MRKISVLLAIVLILAVACDNNDDNTINSIVKSHKTFPAFHVKVDNNYKTFGVDSLQLTVDPAVGWTAPVYSNNNGFIGTLASGTYITSIDTTIDGADTTVDTSSVVYGFNPHQTYTFRFTRADTFSWIDSFKIDYAMSVDSSYIVLSAETLTVLELPDTNTPTRRNPDSVGIVTSPFDTLVRIPDSIVRVERFIAEWFGQTIVLSGPEDTMTLSPDTAYYDTVVWAYWSSDDSLFLPVDSSEWCDIAIDTVVNGDDTTYNDFFVIKDTIKINGFVFINVDTVTRYVNCQPEIGNTQNRIYNVWGWGDYDTTKYTTFPDTTKQLIFNNGVVSVRNTVTDVTKPAKLYFIQNGTTTSIDSLVLNLTLPDVEVFPEYDIIIKDE